MALESLGTFLRLARERRNLNPGQLAKLAGVSRWQVVRMEQGHNVSIEFLLKVAAVLELTEIEAGPLTIRTGRPDTYVLLLAAEALEKARKATGRLQDARREIDDAAETIDALLVRPQAPAAAARRVAAAAERLAKTPPHRVEQVGRALRESAESPGKRLRAVSRAGEEARPAKRRAR